MKTIAILALAATLLEARCIQVTSSQIVAGDLAGAIPLFQTAGSSDAHWICTSAGSAKDP